MLYAFAYKGGSYEPELVIGENEQALVKNLKAFFGTRKPLKASDLVELEAELESMGRGYHGAADLVFEIVKPFVN
jgi:hypothetical protein